MVRAEIECGCDWTSDSGDDQRGHVRVTTATGVIEGTWSCTGGMGDGAELVSNTTEEYDDDDAAWELLDSAAVYQGLGTYAADITGGEYDWPTLENVTWLGP